MKAHAVTRRVTRSAEAGGAPTDTAALPPQDVLTLDQVRERYPDQWVVLDVSRQDRHGYASAGRVVAHTPDGDAAHAAALRHGRNYPAARLAIFYQGDVRLPPDVEIVL